MAAGQVAKTPVSRAELDYVRVTWADIHGIPRARAFPIRHLDTALQDGVRVYAAIIGLGPRTEVVLHQDIPSQGNLTVRPCPETLHALPWAGGPEARVGQVLADCQWPTGDPHGACTRSILRRQLERLRDEFKLQLMTSFEYEFMELDETTGRAVFDDQDAFTSLVLAQFEDFLYGMERRLAATGIDIEGIHVEYASGQFELATAPALGLQGADQAFLLKAGVKEISAQKGYRAVFMTKPFPERSANGGHLNFSLWDATGTTNVGHDACAADKLSETFRHWLAGLVKHAPALCALCSPTVNCYRRMHTIWCPSRADWGLDNRAACFRIKNYSPRCTYTESRLPSSAANPYLTIAATVAAGMDGLRHRLPLPSQMDPAAVLMPSTMEEALDALEKDEVIKEALGEQFMRWFMLEKNSIELEGMKNCQTDEEKLKVERHFYEKFI